MEEQNQLLDRIADKVCFFSCSILLVLLQETDGFEQTDRVDIGIAANTAKLNRIR